MSYFNEEEIVAIAGEMQLTVDDSVFVGEAYVEDDKPEVVQVHLTGEVLNEPGACGVYPFYESKDWLTDKVLSFCTRSLDDILEAWGCTDATYDANIEAQDVQDDACSLLVTIFFD